MDWLLIIDEGLQTKQQSIQFSELFNPPAWWRWFLVNKWQRDAEFDFILALIIRIDSSPIPSPPPPPPSLSSRLLPFLFASLYYHFPFCFCYIWLLAHLQVVSVIPRPPPSPAPPPLLPVGPASHFLEKKRTQTNSMKSSTLFSPFLLFLHSINTQKNYNIINSSIIITTTKKKNKSEIFSFFDGSFSQFCMFKGEGLVCFPIRVRTSRCIIFSLS